MYLKPIHEHAWTLGRILYTLFFHLCILLATTLVPNIHFLLICALLQDQFTQTIDTIYTLHLYRRLLLCMISVWSINSTFLQQLYIHQNWHMSAPFLLWLTLPFGTCSNTSILFRSPSNDMSLFCGDWPQLMITYLCNAQVAEVVNMQPSHCFGGMHACVST